MNRRGIPEDIAQSALQHPQHLGGDRGGSVAVQVDAHQTRNPMISRALAVVLTFAAGTTILGQASTPTVPPAEKPAASATAEPVDAIRKLSRRERKQRLEKLDVRHQDFAADVEPIILPAELDMFLMLESDAQRDAFVD